MIDSGKRFVQLLDAHALKPKAAFWIYNKDEDRWHLFVGHLHGIGDDIDSFDKKAESLISANKQQLPQLQLSDIVLASESAPILELLNSVVNTGDEILGINFVDEKINDVVLDGLYLYRMNISELNLS
ncbi:MAG TPA: hypothetical protein ENK93_00940 [Campylobacteraceae bacterium]|nr:hypothetical protein [Campylobacteraceae bacterium]